MVTSQSSYSFVLVVGPSPLSLLSQHWLLPAPGWPLPILKKLDLWISSKTKCVFIFQDRYGPPLCY